MVPLVGGLPGFLEANEPRSVGVVAAGLGARLVFIAHAGFDGDIREAGADDAKLFHEVGELGFVDEGALVEVVNEGCVGDFGVPLHAAIEVVVEEEAKIEGHIAIADGIARGGFGPLFGVVIGVSVGDTGAEAEQGDAAIFELIVPEIDAIAGAEDVAELVIVEAVVLGFIADVPAGIFEGAMLKVQATNVALGGEFVFAAGFIERTVELEGGGFAGANGIGIGRNGEVVGGAGVAGDAEAGGEGPALDRREVGVFGGGIPQGRDFADGEGGRLIGFGDEEHVALGIARDGDQRFVAFHFGIGAHIDGRFGGVVDFGNEFTVDDQGIGESRFDGDFAAGDGDDGAIDDIPGGGGEGVGLEGCSEGRRKGEERELLHGCAFFASFSEWSNFGFAPAMT